MYEVLRHTNPRLLHRFLADFGNLKWLADKGLIDERIRIAGRTASKRKITRLEKLLHDNPVRGTAIIHRAGLLVPEKTVAWIRGES